METICFYNRKGGPGKTSSTINIAGCLDRVYKKKVLVVDCDSQSNSTDFLFASTGFKPNKTLETYLRGEKIDINEIIYPVSLNIKEGEPVVETGIHIIPATPYMDSIGDFDITLLKDLLEQVEDEYDYCVIDCTPYLSPCTLSAFCASRWIITVAEPDIDSIGGYDLLIDAINNIKEKGYNDTLELLGIYLNKVFAVDAIGNHIIDEFREFGGDSVFDSYVRNARMMKQLRYFGIPASYYAPSSTLAKDYKKLTGEIINRIETKRNGGKQ